MVGKRFQQFKMSAASVHGAEGALADRMHLQGGGWWQMASKGSGACHVTKHGMLQTWQNFPTNE